MNSDGSYQLVTKVKVGDKVWVAQPWEKRGPGKGRKMWPVWRGPAVVEWLGEMGGCQVRYEVDGLQEMVNLSKLRRYYEQ